MVEQVGLDELDVRKHIGEALGVCRRGAPDDPRNLVAAVDEQTRE
jgi:hypothetical protein